MSGLGINPVVRVLRPAEAREAARVLHRSAEEAYRNINWNHSEDETVNWFTNTVGKWEAVFVAVVGGEICGVMCIEPDYIDQLFVHTNWQGKGIGTALLGEAKRQCPNGFRLMVFQKNATAVAFYDRQGLRRGKEGISEQEGEKDFEYHWEPDSERH